MKRAGTRSMMLVLRAYLDGESREVCDRHSGRIAEFIIDKAMRGHFGYFKLVLDLVDGKLHRTANEEMTFESDCLLVANDDGRGSSAAIAARARTCRYLNILIETSSPRSVGRNTSIYPSRAILPSPYQWTSSRSISDLKNPTDLCPYLKSTTASQPFFRAISAKRRLTSSRFLSWAEVMTPPISTRTDLMILADGGHPSTKVIPSKTVVYTSSLHDDDNFVALPAEARHARCRDAFHNPSLLCVGV
jgi:hypothetical protein